MTDPLDLVHLRTLVSIADTGGFHRAAAALQLSQSTISQHIRLLERRFKEPLVEKAGRARRLTIAGEAILAEARRILAVHDEALQRLASTTGPAIVVGCNEHTSGSMLPAIRDALSADHPGRSIRFRIDRSARLEEAVARGVLDVAVVLAGSEPTGTEVGPLRLRWYSAPGFAEKLGLEPENPWSLCAFEEPCGLRQRAMAALGSGGRPVSVAAESTSLEGVVSAARAGVGLALLPVGGRPTDGLAVVDDLPDLGSIGLRLIARRGIDPTVEKAVEHAARVALAPLA